MVVLVTGGSRFCCDGPFHKCLTAEAGEWRLVVLDVQAAAAANSARAVGLAVEGSDVDKTRA